MERLNEQLREHETSISINEESGVLTVKSAGVGFDSMRADYLETSQPFIDTLALALAQTLPCFLSCPMEEDDGCSSINAPGACLSAVFVEGHSDNDPWWDCGGVGKRVRCSEEESQQKNVVLSARRALSTLTGLGTAQPALTTLQNDEDQHLWAIAGYGSKRPLDPGDQDSDEAKERNRRIDFRFVMAPPPPLDELVTE